MKILIDQDIPYVYDLMKDYGYIVRKPGRQIIAEDLRDIDAVIVRSVTQIDAALLKYNTSLKFIGSVTSGDDHIDKAFLNEKEIAFYVAKGCNAPAVVAYVLSVIANLKAKNKLPMKPLIAIIGVGHVGRLLNASLQTLGFTTLCYDPPRASQDSRFVSCSWGEVLKANLICLHSSLSRSGDYPTHHLINGHRMSQFSKGTVILNASRGAVVDNQAIKHFGQHLVWCLDVWENEPLIDLGVLRQAFIATPHIAGYSKESQWRAVLMVYQAFCEKFEFAIHADELNYPQGRQINIANWRNAAAHYLDLLKKTEDMQSALFRAPGSFDYLRSSYRSVSESSFYERQ